MSFQTKNKSVSLPKLKSKSTQNQSQIQIKPKSNHLTKMYPQIHKVKWGLAPTCLIEGHQGKQVLYVCINPKCKQLTRLICQTCFYSNHSQHSQQCLAIDQIKSAKIQKLRYWPFQKQYRKMFEFITKHESYVSNLVQDVNATFRGMAIRLVNQIDKIRLKILTKIDNFYLKQTVKQQFSDEVRTQLKQCFQLNKLHDVIGQLFTKKIKHDVFTQKIHQILNNQQILKSRRKLLNYFQTSQKGKDMEFDKMYFLRRESWIMENIEKQQAALKQVNVIVAEDLGIQKIIPKALDYFEEITSQYTNLKFQKKILQDGSTYVGFFQNDLKEVIGKRKYKNGFCYYGNYKKDIRSGWGFLQNKITGYRYQGNWKDDRKNGYGRQESFTSIYQGNFHHDKKQGFGVLIKDGCRFEIQWKQDKMNGDGKKIQKNGVQQQIYYFNGKQIPTKTNKTGASLDIKQLTKRFNSVSTKSIITEAKSL